jgi:hypothetical protein
VVLGAACALGGLTLSRRHRRVQRAGRA